MSIEQAIEYLKESLCNQKQGESYQKYHNAVLNLAIKALEKQIPKKYKTDIYKDKICPICESILQGRKRYCHWCGQKIDWK